ncbi:hypothetical protein ACQ4PT_060833 [Festuca glaucescens]
MPQLQGFVADNIFGGFEINNELNDNTHAAPEPAAAENFVPRPGSATSGNASNAAEEISSQPVIPYVGMIFDDLEVAKEVYNQYAFKMGFGIHISNTKYSQARGVPKDTPLSRVFACVHSVKPVVEAQRSGKNVIGVAAKCFDSTVDMSSSSAQRSKGKQAVEQMDVRDSRQRNKVLRHDCKACMLVDIRNSSWTVTFFEAAHTHPMVSRDGRRRYYRSHRKVPEEDFQLLQTLHNQNISTEKIMGALGDVHGGDLRGLGYVKRDISNLRMMLREEVTLRDMNLTVEYFERRQAESPGFFFATQLDMNNAVRALFWVDGRTRSLYHKYKDCVFFDTTLCTNSWRIERQGLQFYTSDVFDRFQKILQRSTGFYPLRAEVDGLCFDLVPNPGLDVKIYRVEVVPDNQTYTCGCNLFEMCGLICPHIVRVMVHLNVQQIPDRYMLPRWSAAATTPAPDPGTSGVRFGVPATNTLKYNSLCRKINDLASDACISDDTYAMVSDMIAGAKKVVATMHKERIGKQQVDNQNVDPPIQNQEQPDVAPRAFCDMQTGTTYTNSLRNPARVKPKGRPSEKEKRRKPLIELRDEANKKRRKKAEEPKKKESKPKRKARVKNVLSAMRKVML